MYSRWRERLRHTLGFRLALWYAIVFVASSLALTGLTYFLVDASLRQYDREIIGTTLVQYATAYQAGGVAGLQEEIQRTQATAAPGPLLVRVVGARQAVTFLSRPEEWRDFDLSRLTVPFAGRRTDVEHARHRAGGAGVSKSRRCACATARCSRSA